MMNGGHDVGGMHGFGPINAESEALEPVFHADWEKRVFGLSRAASALGQWNGDMSRHARERQHPVDYLRHSYYENWLAGLERLLMEAGLVTAEELASGKAARSVAEDIRNRLLRPEEVAESPAQGSSAAMPADAPPCFQPGDRIRAVNRQPA